VRSKTNVKTEAETQAHNGGKYWDVDDVLDERKKNGKFEYLLQWRDINPKTGRAYSPTWVGWAVASHSPAVGAAG
jgi:hypothetical protein